MFIKPKAQSLGRDIYWNPILPNHPSTAKCLCIYYYSFRLGNGTTETNWHPKPIYLLDNQKPNPPIAGVACGGRHTMVWLTNGNVFSFGNNFYAQLGYDFKEQNYKENQVVFKVIFISYKSFYRIYIYLNLTIIPRKNID